MFAKFPSKVDLVWILLQPFGYDNHVWAGKRLSLLFAVRSEVYYLNKERIIFMTKWEVMSKATTPSCVYYKYIY